MRVTSKSSSPLRGAGRLAGVALIVLAAAAPPAGAQLDQLLFIKRVMPSVIVVVDTSFRMLDDGRGNYFDPNTYNVSDDAELAKALGVDTSAAESYRRVYLNLRYVQPGASGSKFESDRVVAVPDNSPFFSTLYQRTRLDIAMRGIEAAVSFNRGSRFRWGLMRLPQTDAAWPDVTKGCDKPVQITGDANQATLTENWSYCSAGNERLGIFTPTVSGANTSAPNVNAHLVAATDLNSASLVLNRLARKLPDRNPYLIPAGRDSDVLEDRPLTKALTEARSRAVTAITNDTTCPTCRNTVVVLVTGGSDRSADAAAKASEFLTVTVNGLSRRVPIFVVGVNAAEPDKPQLRAIATNSGGVYFDTRDASGVTRAINRALQTGFGRWSEFNEGAASEHITVSPVIGTVNLVDAPSATGADLTNDEVSTPQGVHIPQRNNLLITAGFAIGKATIDENPDSPGFDGRLRAFRAYKPITDSSKPSGYTFTKDGTPVWPDRDGRSHLAGQARTPTDSSIRNVYTYVPGHGTIAFSTGNADTLRPYLGGADPWQLIPWVRSLPLGAIVGSTPAVMDPPSMEPPPDTDYGRPDGDKYAGHYKDRRAIIWVGANDGMLHAIDARTGFEVWAFIPFNLLPKLKTLSAGQAVEQFWYFVDHSAKIAEVKMNGEWRTYLVIGEGPGGTFYQAFDVTEAGMGGPLPSSDDYQGVLQTFADPNRVQFKWAFPSYTSFDPNVRADIGVADATPGGVVHFYGELSPAATAAERSVGFSWSDPAVGPLDLNRDVNVAIVGSGYFPAEAEASTSPLPARSGAGAGRSLYLIRLSDGKLLGNPSGTCSGTGCLDAGDVNSNSRKNALQADPTVTGDTGGYVAKRAYIGDLDGNYWRFNFGPTGLITKTLMYAAAQPIYASSALMNVGTTQQYMFFATGSDLLPTTPASAGGTGTFKLIAVKDAGAGGAMSFTQNLVTVTDNAGIAVGERPSASPSVAGDIVFFTTTVETATPCTDFSFNLWALTYTGGSAYLAADATPPDKKNNNPPPTPVVTGVGRATAPFVVDQHLWFGTTGAGGANVEAFGDPNDFNNGVGQVGVRILSWREIRR